MQVTLFGAIWVFIMLIALMDTRRTLTVTMLSMVLQCNNVLVIGNTGIGVQIFTVCFACLRIFLTTKPSTVNIAIKKKARSALFIFITVVCLSVAVHELDTDALVSISLLAIYAFFAYLMISRQLPINEKWLEKTIGFVVVFVLTVGVLQFLCVYNLLPIRSILKTLVYNDVGNSNVIFNYKLNHKAFYSTFMEPSFCGAFLIGAFSYYILKGELSKRNLSLLVGIVFAIMLTKSATAYGGLLICVLILLFLRNDKKIFRFLLPTICISAILMFTLFNGVIEDVIFDKFSSSSFNVRNNWNNRAMKIFKNNIWLGIGYGNIRASGLFQSILGGIGLIGMAAYAWMIRLPLFALLKERKASEYISCAFFVIGVIICQIIACPDLNFSVFWLGMFIFFASLNIRSKSIQESKK